jgi:hypothetical protein
MWVVGPIGFLVPAILTALAALPVLWLILRAVPPAPVRRRFPGVALLVGLKDDAHQTDRTPWWLLLLRCLAVAAAILAFAGPVWNPAPRPAGTAPLLILADGTWADAADWPRRLERIAAALTEAGRAGRPVAVAVLTDLPPGGPPFQAADAWARRLPGLSPRPWEPDAAAVADWARSLPEAFDTLWLSDGLARAGRDDLLAALRSRGAVTVFEGARGPIALAPPRVEDGALTLSALRARTAAAETVEVAAWGPDPAGVERELARRPLAFAAGEDRAEARLELPPELRNRVQRFEIAGLRSAGAVALADDSLARREVALVAGREDRERLTLLSPLHYLRQALTPTADLIEGSIEDVLPAAPDAIVLADVARLTEAEARALVAWVEAGGLLVRFAGPRLAAADHAADTADPLMPVRLRSGGRVLGGAMSWDAPRALAPFPEDSPFSGLPVPPDVTVSAQVLAEPDPALAERTIAALADGTPLVTRRTLGAGQVVLFHVTANAEWSSLPLSGLFVQMLERLALSTRPVGASEGGLAGTVWRAERLMDAFGALAPAGVQPGVPGERLELGLPGPDLPPGLYADGDRRVAVNVIGPETRLAPASWPADVALAGPEVGREFDLKPWLLALALVLLAADVVASLALSGRLRRPREGMAGLAAILSLVVAPAGAARADDAFAVAATTEVVLAHVLTGDPAVDRMAEQGLRGLSLRLAQRTAVEPAEPMAVNLETDELAFFPLLYWPVTPDMPRPSAEAYARLNRYLRNGGMILFDTRDADLGAFGGSTPAGRRLQELAAPLDIPPLEPVPEDHVLTRTFYLLQEFPGRHAGRDIWVEAAPPGAERAEGMPFRNLNDGVTPVVIGGNDWAAAWAVDAQGQPLYPVGRGFAGERQRELALRFGINLVMHVLTGNYKSDQVHVPALLERLGQ